MFFIKAQLNYNNHKMNQLQSRAADTAALYKILLAVSYHCVHRSKLNENILNIQV